jgi:hypothetical protein
MEEVTQLKSELTLNEPHAAPAPPPVPAGSRPGAAATADKGLCAVAQYDYDAAEDVRARLHLLVRWKNDILT